MRLELGGDETKRSALDAARRFAAHFDSVPNKLKLPASLSAFGRPARRLVPFHSAPQGLLPWPSTHLTGP